jgi:hypothetical protein
MSPDQQFVPTEENVLLCDVPGCTAQISMPNDVPREVHGWGRVSIYAIPGGDYDLCAYHYRRLLRLLEGVEFH